MLENVSASLQESSLKLDYALKHGVEAEGWKKNRVKELVDSRYGVTGRAVECHA